MKTFSEDTISNQQFNTESLPKGKYLYYEFKNCSFQSSNLLDIEFVECVFKDCDLSLCAIGNTAFKDVRFINCKLLGLNFSECNNFLLSLDFDNCKLDNSDFTGLLLKSIRFNNCQLNGTDFTNCDLQLSSFPQCNLNRTVFDNTNLEKADFSSAIGYTIDVERNKLKGAKFSRTDIDGLLTKYKINIIE